VFIKSKIKASCAALIILSTIAGSAEDPLHTFTSNNGQKIQASIISVSNDKVKIKRKDGQTFTTSISIYSDQDKEYIRKWINENVTQKADFKIRTSRDIGKKKHISTYLGKKITQPMSYRVTIENLSRSGDFKDIEIEYITFKPKSENVEVGATSTGDFNIIRGKLNIPSLPAGRSFEFNTIPFLLIEQTVVNYAGNKEKVKDRAQMTGISIKMYTGEKLLWEHKEGPTKTRKYWPSSIIFNKHSDSQQGKLLP